MHSWHDTGPGLSPMSKTRRANLAGEKRSARNKLRGSRPNAITVKRWIKTVSALFFLPPVGEEHRVAPMGVPKHPWFFKQGCDGGRMLPLQSNGALSGFADSARGEVLSCRVWPPVLSFCSNNAEVFTP